jgi:hypothetical protein
MSLQGLWRADAGESRRGDSNPGPLHYEWPLGERFWLCSVTRTLAPQEHFPRKSGRLKGRGVDLWGAVSAALPHFRRRQLRVRAIDIDPKGKTCPQPNGLRPDARGAHVASC